MSPTSQAFSLLRTARQTNCLPAARRQKENWRLWVAALGAWVVLAASPTASTARPAPPGKKLIEYGWDVPTPAQMREELATMEKRPFDGLIFRLNGGHNAFVTKPLEPARFAEDERILLRLPFTRFTDNFVLIWGSPPAGFDWFDETQWRAIEANAKLLVGIAQAGRVRGICFDPEPYDFSLWDYVRAYHAMRQRARGLVPPELREKYERQVQAGQALYVDPNFALRQPKTEQYLSYRMMPEERARWFEHNTYWALYTTDEYVWCYSERMNWWKDQTPPGLEAAIVSARQKIAEGKPLGFDLEPLIEAAGKR
jgi:hypothetical protein